MDDVFLLIQVIPYINSFSTGHRYCVNNRGVKNSAVSLHAIHVEVGAYGYFICTTVAVSWQLILYNRMHSAQQQLGKNRLS